MKKLLGATMLLGSALVGFAYADTTTHNMSVCNVITNETTFTGKELIGVKRNDMGAQQGVTIEKAFEVDASTCIYNDKSGSTITLYLVDQSYMDQIGGVGMATDWDVSAQGNITDNRFLKVDGELATVKQQKDGDGVSKITNYYMVTSTQAGYELAFQNQQMNDGAQVTPWNSDAWMQKSVAWLFDIGATRYDTVAAFGANRGITREEAAKFFAQVKMDRSDNAIDGDFSCEFDDMATADQTLKASISQACELGIMKGGNKLFTPKAQLTTEQALVIAMRMYSGKMMDETASPWYKNYLTTAQDAGIFSDGMLSADVGTKVASRGWVAMLLFKAHLAAQK